MIIDLLRREHRNIEKLLLVLEKELNVFDRGEQPDYEVIRAVIAYFEVYPEIYHHPQEDVVFRKLQARDSAAAAVVGDLAAEHRRGAERLRKVSQAIETVLADRIIPRQAVDSIIRDFIGRERQHIAMEERAFFPAAVATLQPQDWSEIASALTEPKRDPLFSEIVNSSSTSCEITFCDWSRRRRSNASDSDWHRPYRQRPVDRAEIVIRDSTIPFSPIAPTALPSTFQCCGTCG